jgi:hypothetical protein
MSSSVDLLWKDGRFGQTSRQDAWWASPLAILLGLTGFIAYATWAALQGEFYWFGPYLSPFYSPELWGDSPHNWFGPKPGWIPAALPWSPALAILWAPVLFRFTCYYYRGTYYKSFWADPPACAVGEPRSSYLGERWFPLVLHNVHRYIFYIAVVFICILSWDAIVATQFEDGFGIGIGTLVLTGNAILLGGYTFGCHCSRHLFGGNADAISQSSRHGIYRLVSWLNARHKNFAWASLFWVAFSDVYIRLCAMGIWTDLRIL